MRAVVEQGSREARSAYALVTLRAVRLGGQEPDGGREELQQVDDEAHSDEVIPAGRQPTGDVAVDDVLARLDAAVNEPLDAQIEVGELVHRVLQSRLADLGKE